MSSGNVIITVYDPFFKGSFYDKISVKFFGFKFTGIFSVNPTCFAAGTSIRTTVGDVAVEDLKVGGSVVTASGAARPIKWIGRRTIDCGAHPSPELVQPIRIQAGAFGGGRPSRDLMLSPHHAVAVTCVDDVLIPIRLLVNGTTISQVDTAEITYFHVELDSHDILVANGLPAESYIDIGNRGEFEGEETLVLHPEFKSEALVDYCRPLVTGGPILSAVRSQLDVGSEASPQSAGSFHLLVDGIPMAPVVKGQNAAFFVPAGARDVRLLSPVWSPKDANPASSDERKLGVLIQSISMDDLLGTVTDVPLGHRGLLAGFHPLERGHGGLRSWRWTDGDALLDSSLWAKHDGPFVLRLSGEFAFEIDSKRSKAA